MKKIFLSIIALIFLFSSCTSSNEEEKIVIPKLLIKNIHDDGTSEIETSKYLYDENNKLIEIDLGDDYLIEIIYDNDKIIRIDQKENSDIYTYEEYDYIGSNISKYKRYENNVLVISNEYNYDTNNQIISKKETYPFNSSVSIIYTYEYNSSNNSVKEISSNNRYTITYYDDKNHPLSGIEYLKPFIRDQANINFNNPIKIENYSNSTLQGSIDFVNEYDIDGYLVKSVATENYGQNNNSHTYTDNYIYNK
ncbi:hypothetical protein [Polaribacter sp. Hel1_85]|uniref:hypothetical protein n=1 Tax=Polaribacter sp. Hel1_85 TaxID=1250005 RepID=UPI00052C1D23|nr:hypothetical protein [Polaribacter sp. Hel1_85]KGL61843.1 hypothetical protein PHEL85_1628 [Polaribacter sp. Hel1_85]